MSKLEALMSEEVHEVFGELIFLMLCDELTVQFDFEFKKKVHLKAFLYSKPGEKYNDQFFWNTRPPLLLVALEGKNWTINRSV